MPSLTHRDDKLMSMFFRRYFLAIFAMAFGLAGTIACVAAICALWSVDVRLRRMAEAVFGKVDTSLVVVKERTERARNRLKESVITTESMVSSLKEWTRQEARQRLALRLNLAENSERLRVAMLQADGWLEV